MYEIRTEALEDPDGIMQDGITIIHLRPTECTEENIERIVAMLNEHAAMRNEIARLKNQSMFYCPCGSGGISEAAQKEIARLRELVKAAYDEGYIAACGERGNITGNWDRSNAKAALDGEGK